MDGPVGLSDVGERLADVSARQQSATWPSTLCGRPGRQPWYSILRKTLGPLQRTPRGRRQPEEAPAANQRLGTDVKTP